MKVKKVGKQTLKLSSPAYIRATSSYVGPKEGQGPLSKYFDFIYDDNIVEQNSWEKAEKLMLAASMDSVKNKAGCSNDDIDFLLAGDLLNQIISANYVARDLQIPFLGLYGACSTMVEGMALGAMLIDGGYADLTLNGASSHFDTAERQYRAPTEMGNQRPLYAQWTVTGAGACLLSSQGQNEPKITEVVIGKVVDLGVKDANDMGSAMAPAVAQTIVQHLEDTGRQPDYYDLILSGDLAIFGRTLTVELAKEAGYDLSKNYDDCGVLIFDPSQDVHAGGSGCGCSAVVIASWLMEQLKTGAIQRAFVIGSGALLSPVAVQQGESIPGIGHGVVIER